MLNLIKKLGCDFKQFKLLEQALTHRSFSSDNNERLEFLGDSILNFIIAEEVWRRFPKAQEGELSRLRSQLVNTESLVELAQFFELNKYLKLGPGETSSHSRRSQTILADAMEAVIAAIYLDSGLDKCREMILAWYKQKVSALSLEALTKDPKTSLQEYLQANKQALPIYTVEKISGEAHAQQFEISCKIAGYSKISRGLGTSRRRAEQAAAAEMLKLINNK